MEMEITMRGMGGNDNGQIYQIYVPIDRFYRYYSTILQH